MRATGQVSVDTAAAPIPPRGRVIGVDLGSRRVGVAVSDADQRLAVGVLALPRSGDTDADRRALLAVAGDHEAVGIVVGVPLSLSGQAGPAARAAAEEVAALRAASVLPVDTVDERLSTVSATAALRRAGLVGSRRRGARQRAVVDQTAAAVILQAWLDGRGEGSPRG